MAAMNTPLVDSNTAELRGQYPMIASDTYNVHLCALLIIVGAIFTWASVEFLFDISNLQVGGCLFVISSILLLYVDIITWWVNNRVGCCCYAEYEASYEDHVKLLFEPLDTFKGRCQRAENGIIGMIAISASFLFTVGSFMFLPSVHLFYDGIIIFIFGSAVLFVVQLWLLLKHRNDSMLCLLHLSGCGCGLLYLIGSVWFMPQFNRTPFDTNGAAGFFIAGGLCFLFVGVSITYRVFFKNQVRVDYRESVQRGTIVRDDEIGADMQTRIHLWL